MPQIRDRFFTVATLPEWGVFKFPEPSHAIRGVEQFRFKGYQLGSLFRVKAPIARGIALHEVITVAEALSDLPLFDW